MKYGYILINSLLIVAMAYFFVEISYKNLIPGNNGLPDKLPLQTISKDIDPQKAKQIIDKNQHKIIVNRNMFKVEIEEKNQPLAKQEIVLEKLEPTTLKLALWGTVTGGSEVFAVIEDKKLRKQSLYQLGDAIQGAKLKKILRNGVVLAYQGKDQFLEMETDPKNVRKPRYPVKKSSIGAQPVNEIIAEDPQDNLSVMMKQVKFRPHIFEGEPDGLLVYGIRPNSVFQQIGLRNGDIIKDINGTAIVSAEDASQLFAEIEDAENAKLTLFRRGKVKEVLYEVKDGQYSIIAVPEDKDKGDE